MTELQLKLLGKAEALLDGHPIQLGTAKAEALLYFLAANPQPHTRDRLIDLLWGEMPPTKAKRNLTTTLSALRKALPDTLNVEPQTVAIIPPSDYTLDLINFEALLNGENIAEFQQGVALYRGDFLAGLHVKNAYGFEEWLLVERERLRDLMLQALDTLVDHYLAHAEYEAGIAMATRLLELEPWQESGHRYLMMLYAQSGQRTAALAQFDQCRAILAEELGVEPTPETIELFNRLRGEQVTVPHNLPSASLFVGRIRLLQQLLSQLQQAECRLLSLVGPGGIGKTRLALEAARQLTDAAHTLISPRYKDGVYFINLASLASETTDSPQTIANGIATIIAETLDVSFQGPTNLTDQLATYLQDRHLLLILDNFEHLVPAAGFLSDLLSRAPHLNLIVTSRERLSLQEEWVLRVNGLDYPDTSHLPQLGEIFHAADLERYDAFALFLQQAQQVRGTMSLSDDDAMAVVEICRLVEGAPLGLILAAGWLPILSCAEIVLEIKNGLDFLATTMKNVPERHRSLRAVFEHSWEMLDQPVQDVYARLSIFRDGFDREAAGQIAQASLPILAQLVNKSLLRLTEQGRYEFHELLRQFADEKLRLTQAGQDLANVYSTYYLQIVANLNAQLWESSPQLAIPKLKSELSNLRQAWQFAVATRNVEVLGASVSGLSRFFDLAGFFAVGVSIFDHAASQLAEIDDAAPLHCRLRIEQARQLHRLGLPEQAMQIAEQATQLAQALNSRSLEAYARNQWGDTLSYHGDYDAAYDQLHQALNLARAEEIQRVEAEALHNLGLVFCTARRLRCIPNLFSQALTCFEALDDARMVSILLMNLGSLDHEQGQSSRGRRALEQALTKFRELEDRWGLGLVTVNLAIILYEAGEYDQALAYSNEALQIVRQLQDHVNEVFVLNNLGNLRRDQGRHSEAQRCYDDGLRLARRIGDQYNEGYLLADQGLLFHFMGQHQAGQESCRRAVQLSQKLGNRSLEALGLTYLGHALVALGQSAPAIKSYQQALEIRHDLGENHRAIDTMAGLAHAYFSTRAIDQAESAVEEILAYLAKQPTTDQLPLTGVPIPLRVYLICIHVLQARSDPRVDALTDTAHTVLQKLATNVSDGEARQRFIDEVPTHQVLLALHSKGSSDVMGRRV